MEKVLGKAYCCERKGEGRVGAHQSEPYYVDINGCSRRKIKCGDKQEIGENSAWIQQKQIVLYESDVVDKIMDFFLDIDQIYGISQLDSVK